MSNSTEDRARDAGETKIRGKDLAGSEQPAAADHVQNAKRTNTDKVVRTDGEKDSLYEDGIELDDGSSPLTGVNGRDDSH
jgi:hypothetical protein